MNFPIRVYYEDTDAGGVVYHANYLHFFERARTEFLRQSGFSQQQLLTQSLAFVVKKMDIDYKSAARLDDLLNVETEVIELGKAKIVFSQSIWKEDRCLNKAIVVIACVNLNQMKPVAIPEEIRQILKK
ncbi:MULTISPECIES: tol-pal system-associated acyl-CoA thioesterase [Pasteurellaceae]|uniref:Tol-pal system-associated acyl-CoA thioesterase n=3 Tax=Pasteurellaceae TaxID=712 RepID=A0ACC6HPC9_9PAST|nr:tol-pal system-associated acyl-CoA thioesterase [Pasteurella atlantica]MBR0572808.1 tol-pal system-associated acyl-CoA thioesterase [Pasteurella atlantica]MDP8038736.1 tol-pal system-associated acyl-CoA thioesterase [Pasteurella atlantica]MDP8040828.1 tol-pal system-associated acyl-CoA thioesterase [Pasteurella atlantica]MDP8042999.1 tol-pal system-associated acyl-CoA thioesterase [Pasteurella atlantica]MDP8045085.1 tol-pal system-associated acyl-CoA thioesterase [Pasteurella atlantica]